ncbi:MAG TPA: hypothetical protein VF670_15155 [Duganella sp.]|jgi:hypothetical protein
MEAHSIYAKFSMDQQDFNRWLESATPVITDFDDWSEMNPDWSDSWKGEFPQLAAMTVAELLEGWKEDEFNQSPLVTKYDPSRGEFVLFQALYDDNLINIAVGIARLRGVQQFVKPGSESYILVAPLFWDPKITALLEILDSGSQFLEKEEDGPPEVMEEADVLLNDYLQALPDD